jgi:hypothetical protein
VSASAFVTASAGFLLAVLWFDLMFDVQVVGQQADTLPEAVLASIAGYYARVTTSARPMNRLITAVMVATLAAIVVEIARGEQHRWVAWASLALALTPIAVAGLRIVPSAGSGLAAIPSGARALSPERSFAATCCAPR